MNIPNPPFLKPVVGTLYKRDRRGRFISAKANETGVFYLDIGLKTAENRKRIRMSLRTRNPHEARLRADRIVWRTWQYAEEEVAKAFHGGGNAVRALWHDDLDTTRLGDIWERFENRYECRERSKLAYKMQYDRFLKWTKSADTPERFRNPAYAGEVTRDMCEAYQRHLFAVKSTAGKDIQCLARIWGTLWPDRQVNPWNTGLHLKAKAPPKAANYRAMTLDEEQSVRRVIATAVEETPEGRCASFGGRKISREFLTDLFDAILLAHYYGMRISDLANFDWKTVKLSKSFFLLTPIKTSGSKPYALEIPILSEVREMLRGREPLKAGPVFPELKKAYDRSQPEMTSAIKQIFVAAGVRDDYRGRASMHSFRATFITNMDVAGILAGVTDSITGHAPKTVHNRYSHADRDAKRRAIEKAIPRLQAKPGA